MIYITVINNKTKCQLETPVHKTPNSLSQNPGGSRHYTFCQHKLNNERQIRECVIGVL